MSHTRNLDDKRKPLDELLAIRDELRRQGKKVAFTNGCFDLLHGGHILTLTGARETADVLIVAVNSDNSVRGLKGTARPIIPEDERCEVLAAMECVDYVVIFDEPNPSRVIECLLPDVLVKGGDWAHNAVVGRETVESHGGRVVRVPPRPDRSSTNIIRTVKYL